MTLPGDRSGETIAVETPLAGAVSGRLAALTRMLVTAAAAPGVGGAAAATSDGGLLCHGLRTTAAGPPRLVLTTALGSVYFRAVKAMAGAASR